MVMLLQSTAFVTNENREVTLMRNLIAAVLAVGAFLVASVATANASSHGLMPAELTFLQALQWETEHFFAHIGYTYEALRTTISSPALGWAMMDEQVACSSAGWLTTWLFGTALKSLLTFGTFVGGLLAFIGWVFYRAERARIVTPRLATG